MEPWLHILKLLQKLFLPPFIFIKVSWLLLDPQGIVPQLVVNSFLNDFKSHVADHEDDVVDVEFFLFLNDHHGVSGHIVWFLDVQFRKN